MSNTICKKHNCQMAIRYHGSGTPRMDFDGLFCPRCAAEEAERIEAERPVREAINQCEAILQKVRMGFVPADRVAKMPWEERNAYYAKILGRLLG